MMGSRYPIYIEITGTNQPCKIRTQSKVPALLNQTTKLILVNLN